MCLCCALDLDEQRRSGFGSALSVYQLEYSRTLIFADGHRVQQIIDTAVDRTQPRLDMPKFRTIFAPRSIPDTPDDSSVIDAAIETPTYDLTVFKLHRRERQALGFGVRRNRHQYLRSIGSYRVCTTRL